jgi:hypothetical protein
MGSQHSRLSPSLSSSLPSLPSHPPFLPSLPPSLPPSPPPSSPPCPHRKHAEHLPDPFFNASELERKLKRDDEDAAKAKLAEMEAALPKLKEIIEKGEGDVDHAKRKAAF